MLEISSITPINGTANASLTQRIIINFTEPLLDSSVLPSMISLISNDSVSVPVETTIEAGKLTIIPQIVLNTLTTYTIYISYEDFSTETKIESIFGNYLTEDIILSFSTQAATAPGPGSPLTNLAVEFTPNAELTTISPKSGLMLTDTIILTLNSPITDTRSPATLITIHEESLTGEIVEAPASISISGADIVISIDTTTAGYFYSVMLADSIDTEYGEFTCENIYRFIKKPTFSMFPISVLRYKLGGLAAYINDYDIYTAIIDVSQNILDNTDIDILAVGPESKLKQAVKDTVFFALIEKLTIEKFADGGGSIQIGNLSVNKSFPNTNLLEYYKGKAEKEVESASLSVQELRVAIRGRYVPRVYTRDWNRL